MISAIFFLSKDRLENFSPEFRIGGYQVLDNYLKSRQGRKLSLDEKENIINVVKVLRFTIDQMQAIDEIWQP